jgi:hypothetical protein
MKKTYFGCFAISLKGRDKGFVYAVVNEDDGFVHLCDGKHRKIENPKIKRKKHIMCFFANKLSEYLSDDMPITNGRLRHAIRHFKENFPDSNYIAAESNCREEE